MRHGKKFNHLSRKTAHRKAMLSNMACSLIEHKTINTTLAKAKALRKYVEPILTKSKTDSTHSRRLVFRYLQNKYTVTELFRDVAPKIADRPGGYTRIIRTGYRLGDNAEMCMIELVDFNELYTNEKTKKNTRRSRRGAGSTATTTEETVEATTDATTTEETVEATTDAATTEETVEATTDAATTEEVVEATTDAASTEEVKVEKVEETTTETKTEVKAEDKSEDSDKK